jgi:hypothetical protein
MSSGEQLKVKSPFFHVGVAETWLQLFLGSEKKQQEFIDVTLLFSTYS